MKTYPSVDKIKSYRNICVLDQKLRKVASGIVGTIFANIENTHSEGVQTVTIEGVTFINTGDKGRWLANGELEIISAAPYGIYVGGSYFLTEDIETIIMNACHVAFCKLINRAIVTGGRKLVLFYSHGGILTEDYLSSKLRNIFPSELMSLLVFSYMPVFPLNENGNVDIDFLQKIQVADNEWLNNLENQVLKQGLLKDVAIVADKQYEEVEYLHVHEIRSSSDISDNNETQTGDIPEECGTAYISGGAFINENEPATLIDVLLKASALTAKGIVYTSNIKEYKIQTYADLLEKAKKILTGLRNNNIEPGDKVIIQVKSLEEYISVFWACIIGGIKPVTVAVPQVYTMENSVVNKLYHVWQLLQNPVILTSDDLINDLNKLGVFFGEGLRTLSITSLAHNLPCQDLYNAAPDDVAFFQLTSGSTGIPKCIQVLHKSVIFHASASASYMSLSDKDVTLNWMNMDHVGALVLLHITDVYLGSMQIQVPIDTILSEPLLWLECIQKYKISVCWAPNFGYKLISESIINNPGFKCDLSSIRILMNGGEQVTLQVVNQFLELTKEFGVKEEHMVPIYGMGELCTAITYKNNFKLSKAYISVSKSSLKGKLVITDGYNDSIPFMEVGVPIRGVDIRIVSDKKDTVNELVIGKIQAKSVSVSPGYLFNETATREAFLADGWYDTGDLGFVYNGRLYVAGRDKETILIRGTHFFCYELEEVVMQVKGVKATYAACCSVITSGEESLAVFFSPEESDPSELNSIISAIRIKISSVFMISPDLIIPVSERDFPKTTSGKIQRNYLKEQLEQGCFDEILKKLHVSVKDVNTTIPQWFYSKEWKRSHLYGMKTISELSCKKYLAFVHDVNLILDEPMTALSGHNVIYVIHGSSFHIQNPTTIYVNPKNDEDYKLLFKELALRSYVPDEIIHTWLLDKTHDYSDSLQGVEYYFELGVYSVVCLLKEFTLNKPLVLKCVTSGAWKVLDNDLIVPAKSMLSPLLRSASSELELLKTLHIDIGIGETMPVSDFMKIKLDCSDGQYEVAFRNNTRYVQRLKHIMLKPSKENRIKLRKNGCYLVTGGLGSIGAAVSAYLLEHFNARLLIVGRTNLNDANSGRSGKYNLTLNELRIKGTVEYRNADLTDFNELKSIKENFEQKMKCALDGVFHIAGDIGGLVDEHINSSGKHLVSLLNRESFLRVFKTKVNATLNLHKLFEDSPSAFFVGFGSVNSYFGGYAFSAYSAGSGFLDAFMQKRQSQESPSLCINWGMWDNFGMNEGNSFTELSVKKGFVPIKPKQGINSICALLKCSYESVLVGLDSQVVGIARELELLPRYTLKLKMYYCADKEISDDVALSTLRPLVPLKMTLQACRLSEMPRKEDGTIDKTELLSFAGAESDPSLGSELITPLEKALIKIWERVLGRQNISSSNNFFELGGDSIKATQLVAGIRKELDTEIDVKDIFSFPTVREMSFIVSRKTKNQSTDIRPVPLQEFYDLSHSQKRFWIMEQFEQKKTSYNVPEAFELNGAVDKEALEFSFKELIRKNEILRTVFVVRDGVPKQKVMGNESFVFNYYELGKENNTELSFEQILKQETHWSFDLSKDPLIRPTLIKLSAHKFVLMVVMHHIVSDGWSIGIMIDEVKSVYNAVIKNSYIDYKVPEIQYKDYAHWHNQIIQGPNGKLLQEFWKTYLSGKLPVLNLITDKERPALQTRRGDTVGFKINKVLKNKLNEFAAGTGSSLYMVLVSVVKALLYRYTNQEDIIIGSPVSGRTHKDLEKMVGLFLNTIPVRTNLKGKNSFYDLHISVRESVFNALKYAEYPFDSIVKDLNVERDMGRFPLFNVVVVLQNINLDGRNEEPMANIEVKHFDTRFRTSMVDLRIGFIERNDQLIFNIDFNTDLFEDQTIRYMGERLLLLMGEAMDDPHVELNNLLVKDKPETKKMADRDFNLDFLK